MASFSIKSSCRYLNACECLSDYILKTVNATCTYAKCNLVMSCLMSSQNEEPYQLCPSE